MKRFKPFTYNCDKCTWWYRYWENKMRTYAKENWKTVYLKEKYGRVDSEVCEWGPHQFMQTMLDYERMSEDSCMYCNKHCTQHWTHEDGWVIHLCLPCLIGDKITILLEKIIRFWRKIKTKLNLFNKK